MKQLLNISHWNVAGLNDTKIDDVNLLNFVQCNDIACVSETHCGEVEDISINNYECFKLSRKQNRRINRFFGGIAIYYKSQL